MRSFYFMLCLVFLTACTQDPADMQEPELVVEGWIDSGGYPVVFVTTSLPINSQSGQSSNLSDHLLKWAKVSISDGTNETILTGKYMKDYTIPYAFTTTDLKGECGKTYQLVVDYPPYHAEATTTIPPLPDVSAVSASICEDNDTLYNVKVGINHISTDAAGYKLFAMRKNKEDTHLSCYMGTFDAKSLTANAEIPLFNVHKMNNKNFSPYFSLNDTLSIKVSTITNEALQFWNDFESNVSLSKSPFFATYKNLRGNLTGALGYWLGYGSNYYIVIPPKKQP